ncbi:MAG: hypothetical protein GX254_05165 [Clostridiales bacterium]|jgi:hypothetical protein|nr:hypothetical protein [Clostridiales bacterium]
MAVIEARFESRDMADIAMSRLRRKGIAYKISDTKIEDSYNKTPFAPQYIANLIFPFTPPNLTNSNSVTDTNFTQPIPGLASRSVLSAETIGLPLYGEGGEVHIRFIVNDANRDTARAILRNSGGYNIK